MNVNTYAKLWCKIAREFFNNIEWAMEPIMISHNRVFSLSSELLDMPNHQVNGTICMSRTAFDKKFRGVTPTDYIHCNGGFTEVNLCIPGGTYVRATYQFGTNPFSRAKGTMVAMRKILSQTVSGREYMNQIDNLVSKELSKSKAA